MIEFLFNAKARVLLVRFATMISGEALADLNGRLDEFVLREGPVDTIFDCGGADVGSTEVVISQGLTPSRIPGKRRVFVAGSDVLYGVFRLYGTYQKSLGTPAPAVVRSLEEALAMLGADTQDFSLETELSRGSPDRSVAVGPWPGF